MRNLLKIENARFQKIAPKNSAPEYIFKKPIKRFVLGADNQKPDSWGIIGPRKSDFLKIVASKFVSIPPLSRSYPYFSEIGRPPRIQFLDFRDSSGLEKSHLSARYEAYSHKGQLEIADDVNSVQNYVSGKNNFNQSKGFDTDEIFIQRLLTSFGLMNLRNNWVNSLSNGQMRRARLAKAIYTKPDILVIDDPFLGLDPRAACLVSEVLEAVSSDLNISIVAGFRSRDNIPKWIARCCIADNAGLTMTNESSTEYRKSQHGVYIETNTRMLATGTNGSLNYPSTDNGTAHIEFDNAYVTYGTSTILKDFNWRIEKGSKWRILGENGSGKTTLLSMITAEHPQSWRSVLSINGHLRRSGSGITYFDVNNNIGISSPELHSLVPPRMTINNVILNGLISNIGNSNFRVPQNCVHVSPHASLVFSYFKDELREYVNSPFIESGVSIQKLALFMRAVLKNPKLLILDEAFSGMEDEIMANCHSFVREHLKKTTVLAVGHVDSEVPPHDYVLELKGDCDYSYKFFTTNKP